MTTKSQPKLVQIDAIRYIPASFDPYQGRVHGEGYAIAIPWGVFHSILLSDGTMLHPWTWIVIKGADGWPNEYWVEATK